MQTDESEASIALQPETETEQALLAELFTRLTNISEAPPHPTKLGNRLVFYTLDVDEYDGLNEDLWEEAECTVNDNGQLDPEPGSRALVVFPNGPPEQSDQPTEEEVDEAVEAVKEADDGGNEFTEDPEELAKEVRAAEELEDVEYTTLQDLAKRASTVGPMDIPANQSTEDIIDDLRAFADTVEASE